jgi:hypothetical protein
MRAVPRQRVPDDGDRVVRAEEIFDDDLFVLEHL